MERSNIAAVSIWFELRSKKQFRLIYCSECGPFDYMFATIHCRFVKMRG